MGSAHPSCKGIDSILPADGKRGESCALLTRYRSVRRFSECLCEPLANEDYVVQSMPEASPTKWHLAHTTWFFEAFFLPAVDKYYRLFNPNYKYLFNSYYNAVGRQYPRPQRGLLSRPTVDEIWNYRKHIDECVADILDRGDPSLSGEAAQILDLGINHEQQHQELMLTDLKHLYSCNPLRPVYDIHLFPGPIHSCALRFEHYPEGVHWIGHGSSGFSFDNETPCHLVFCKAFRIGSRLVTNQEYLEFIEDAGYQRPELWLSAGWESVQTKGWVAPLYWEKQDSKWMMMSLSGLRAVRPDEPVCHVSYFEADAYARWADARLPTEWEWEVAAQDAAEEGSFAEDGYYHPLPLRSGPNQGKIAQMLGDVWEWTQSAYTAYPGFRPVAGALGEYNGKFMCNQLVLRGGSCATSQSHIRTTYRNFFPPEARWQFSGIRLAGDAA
jgi:ergothioneine biosynthesis protein EgtB